MKFRGLDVNGDWMFGQGIGSYARNADEIALDLATRIRSWYGNCFFDPNTGIDWAHRLDKNQQNNLLSELRNVINATVGVVQVLSLTAITDPGTRECHVQCGVQTIFNRNFQVRVAALAGQSPVSAPNIPST